jgi:hypothetical protein
MSEVPMQHPTEHQNQDDGNWASSHPPTLTKIGPICNFQMSDLPFQSEEYVTLQLKESASW